MIKGLNKEEVKCGGRKEVRTERKEGEEGRQGGREGELDVNESGG